MKVEIAALLAGGAALVSAQQSTWGQCGGIGWTGPTTCTSGNYCSVLNPYYSQCLPGGPATTTTSSRTTTTASRTTTTSSRTTTTSSRTTTTSSRTTTTSSRTTTTSSRTTTQTATPTKFRFVGVNEAGAEFGENVIPGELGRHYTWPSPSSIDYFVNQGFNTFRINTKMERYSPPSTGGLTGPFNETYLAGLDNIVNYVTGKGAYAIIDPHNYGRFSGQVITDHAAFEAWWVKVANRYKNNARVIFDTNNEYHTMENSNVFALNQAAINGIRSTGATQIILVEGNSWSGAHSWISSGNAASLVGLTDPLNNLIYQMHQYLDSDYSGTNAECQSATVLADKLVEATNWCRSNSKRCLLGEVGAGTSSTCQQAIRGGLQYALNSGVWEGVLWWAAGPWWPANYFQGIEPPNGLAVSTYVPILRSFAV